MPWRVRSKRGTVEPPVVVDPTPRHRIDLLCQVVEGPGRAPMDPPPANLGPHPLAGRVGHRGGEPDEQPTAACFHRPGAKRVAEEGEPDRTVPRPAPIVVPAVHDMGLALVELQAT